MCVICKDFNKDMALSERIQGVRNLFELKEQIGVKHAQEVVSMLSVNIDYNDGNLDGRIFKAVKEFITPEAPPVIDKSQL